MEGPNAVTLREKGKGSGKKGRLFFESPKTALFA